MKNQLLFRKRLSQLFYCLTLMLLFATSAVAQDTFTWNGSSSTDWATAANWTKTGTAGTDTYPGETNGRKLDLVVINNGGTPIVATNVNPYGMLRMTISNATGPSTGSVLTINSGATLEVLSSTLAVVTLSGGNIINNGTLNVTSTNIGASAGITCATPSVVPLSATEYIYSGSGLLNASVSASTTANSAGINVTSLNANTTYKFLFNGSTTFSLGSVQTSYAVRSAGGTLASPVIIGGAGFTHGTVGSPVNGGLLNVGQQSNVTINNGTMLTLNSASTNLTSGVLIGNSSTNAVTFTNKGTINILGSSSRSGLFFTTFLAAATVSPFNIFNEGTINVNLNCSVVGNAPLATGNGGSTNTTTSAINLNNSGTLTLINTSTSVGTGAAIFGLIASQAPPVVITNNGTLNLEGSSYNYGNKFSVINNSILNTNSELRGFTAVTNNVGGSINFVRTAATATTRQVTFNGMTLTSAAGLGAIYSDGTNSYAVVNQKFSTGGSSTLTANVLSSATVGTGLGTLTKTNAIAGDASIAFTSVTVPALNGALTSTTTNSGTVNTDTLSNLNIILGVSNASSGTIAPGGASGKGIADFAKASTAAISSKLNLHPDTSAPEKKQPASCDAGCCEMTAVPVRYTATVLPGIANG